MTLLTLLRSPISTGALTQITMGASLTASPAMTTAVGHPRTVSASLVVTPAMTRVALLKRTLTANLVMTPIITRKPFKTVAVNLVLTAATTLRLTKFITLSATLTDTVSITFQKSQKVLVTIASSLSATPVLSKIVKPQPMAASLVLSPVINRRLSKLVASTFTATPSLTSAKSKFITIPATFTATAVFSTKRVLYRTLGASVSLSAAQTLRKYALVPLNASTGLSAALSRRLYKPLAAGVSTNPALGKVAPMKLAAISSIVSNLALVKKSRVVTLNLSAFPGISAALGFYRTQVRKFFVELGMVEPVILSASPVEPETQLATFSSLPEITRVNGEAGTIVSVPGVEKPTIERVS